MLKVEIKDKDYKVYHPIAGNTTFDKGTIDGLNKTEFKKIYKGKLDAEIYWESIKAAKESAKKKEVKVEEIEESK